MRRHHIGPIIVSVIVLTVFGIVLYMVLTHSLPPGNEKPADIALGALTTMAAAVVNYWVGSSAGSAEKTQLMANQGKPQP